MKKRNKRAFIYLMIGMILATSLLSYQTMASRKSVIPNEENYVFDVPGLAGSNDMLLQDNPDRGLRMEVYLDVETNKSLFEYKDIDAIEQLEQEIALYKSDNPKLVQVYFYLTGYKDKDLDQKAFDNMEAYFKKLEEHDLKAVFRFAYVWDDTKPTAQEPSIDQIEKHLEQAKPFIEEHRDQIHVFQAGIVGAWGEWDSGAMGRIDQKRVMNTILENTPDDMYIQVRYIYIKNNNVDKASDDWNRVGYHDDFLIGTLHGWNTAGSNPNSDGWKQMTSESANLLIDGEMIWGSANDYYTGGKSIDAFLMAQRLQEHHFTSLSMTHNYKESNKESGKEYSMAEWQKEYINPTILDQYGLRYDPYWFKDESGNNIPRNMFEYIRDYLGYYLKVDAASATVKGEDVSVDLTIHNYGFAAPLRLTTFDIVLLDADGNEVDNQKACNVNELQPGTKDISVKLTRPDVEKPYTVAIKARAEGDEPVRFANDITHLDGYTVLGILK